MADHPLHLALGEEGEQVHSSRGHRRVGRKGDDGPVGGARHLPSRLNRGCEERPEDEFRPFRDRGLCRVARALRRAAIVLDEDLDVRVLELGKRQFGGIAQRVGGDRARTFPAQRQDQPDLDAPGADRVAARRLGLGVGPGELERPRL